MVMELDRTFEEKDILQTEIRSYLHHTSKAVQALLRICDWDQLPCRSTYPYFVCTLVKHNKISCCHCLGITDALYNRYVCL